MGAAFSRNGRPRFARVSQRVDPSNPRVRYWRGRRTGTSIPFVASSVARRAEAELGPWAGGRGGVADAVALAGPSDAERVYGEAASSIAVAAADSVASSAALGE